MIIRIKMDQMQDMQKRSKYQKACIVIAGDVMEDWKYVFRELKTMVSASQIESCFKARAMDLFSA